MPIIRVQVGILKIGINKTESFLTLVEVVLNNPSNSMETAHSVGNTVVSTCVFHSGVREFAGNKLLI